MEFIILLQFVLPATSKHFTKSSTGLLLVYLIRKLDLDLHVEYNAKTFSYHNSWEGNIMAIES